jgi:4-hydroxy-2-oxoglutarate aldolase
MSVDLSGVLIPCTTPFDPVTGEVDLVGLRANFRSWLAYPIRGILVGGSTGEALLLDEDERLACLEGARDVIPEDRLLLAGTGAESTRATVRRCDVAAEAGADAVLVQPPVFYRGAMTESALLDHYRAVARASSIPVIVYQVPLHLSTIEFSTNLLADLSKVDNIIGMKDSRGSLELLGEVLSRAQDDFQVLVGSGAAFYGGLELGAVGGILAVACMAPGRSAAIHTAFVAGDSAEAGHIQEVVGPVHREIVGGMGVPGVKVAMDLLGMRGGDPRPPLQPPPDHRRDEVTKVLDRAGLAVTTGSSA